MHPFVTTDSREDHSANICKDCKETDIKKSLQFFGTFKSRHFEAINHNYNERKSVSGVSSVYIATAWFSNGNAAAIFYSVFLTAGLQLPDITFRNQRAVESGD